MAQSAQIDPGAFAEAGRGPMTRDESGVAMRQAIAHSARPVIGRGNRGPDCEELLRRWKLSRRWRVGAVQILQNVS